MVLLPPSTYKSVVKLPTYHVRSLLMLAACKTVGPAGIYVLIDDNTTCLSMGDASVSAWDPIPSQNITLDQPLLLFFELIGNDGM